MKMPTVQAIELPKPKNWQDFEQIVRDAMSQRWKSPDLQMNGRMGQKQNGIDIYGCDEIGRQVGIQCKCSKRSPTLDTIRKEISAAETFEGVLSTIYIATTADYDSALQKDVRLLSDKRVIANKFSVSLIFWEEVVNGLVLNPDVFKAHYPQIKLTASLTPDRERQLAALELGYYGAELWESVLLFHGEFGWMAQVDPDGLIATIQVMERRISQLLAPLDAEPILTSLAEVRDGCMAKKEKESDWDLVEAYAKRFESRLVAANSLLSNGEDKALDLGMQLSRIYHHFDDLPSADAREQIKAKVMNLSSSTSAGLITTKFTAAVRMSSGYTWAPRIYNAIAHELRWMSI